MISDLVKKDTSTVSQAKTSESPSVVEFLHVATPQSWCDAAVHNVEVLLIDHANCERKAASSALSMSYRFSQRTRFLLEFSRIVREEMRHFEQVLALIREQDFQYRVLSASRYASSLHKFAREHSPIYVDELLIAAIIEARSYERLDILSTCLNSKVAQLYKKLRDSEYRHYLTYIRISEQFEQPSIIEQRLDRLLDFEADLVTFPDSEFRFHSGVPINGKQDSVNFG